MKLKAPNWHPKAAPKKRNTTTPTEVDRPACTVTTSAALTD